MAVESSADLLTVDVTESGQRLDAFLKKRMPGVTGIQVEAWIRTGAVRIRGKLCKPLRRIHRGDEVTVIRPSPKPAVGARSTVEPIAILHQSEHVVAIDKPTGLAVEAELLGALALQRPGWNVGGRAEPGVVHRLDRDTSGCLLLARTDLGLAHLHAAFESGTIEKTYRVAVVGQPPSSGRIETPYGRDPANPRRFTTRIRSPRRAALRFRTLHCREGYSILEVQLETGRTHQIRVQLLESGWPVLGDATYGTPNSRAWVGAPRRQALHAFELSFPLPGGERVVVRAPVPSDLVTVFGGP